MSYAEGDYRPPGVGDNQSKGEVSPIVALAEQGSPEVIELVNILYSTYTLHQSLQAAADQPQEMNTFPVHVDPSFTERYRRASLFVEAAVHIMRGSFIAYPEDPAHLRNVLKAAFAPYGYQVVEGKDFPGTEEDDPGSSKGSSPYERRLMQQIERYALSRKGAQIQYKMLDLERAEPIDENEVSRWEPVGEWEDEPEVLDFTEHINRLERMQGQLYALIKDKYSMSSTTEEKAEQVPGLHPYYRERYDQARLILHDVKRGVMKDGFAHADWFNWLTALAFRFNDALYDLDMHIDVNPKWQPDQHSIAEKAHQYGLVTRIKEVKPQTS